MPSAEYMMRGLNDKSVYSSTYTRKHYPQMTCLYPIAVISANCHVDSVTLLMTDTSKPITNS